MMEKITESLYEAQDHAALNGLTIHLGGYTKTNVNLYVPLAFVIADVPEANDICSFYTVTSKTSGPYRICCACDVTLDDACCTTQECHRYEQVEDEYNTSIQRCI